MPNVSLLAAAAAAVVIATGAIRVPAAVAPPVPPLSAVAFMSGCWTGRSANGATIEERYSEPAENLMLGMTRYVRDGRVVDFEFTTIERTDSTFSMTPRPKGVRSDSFALESVGDGVATWENLAHDFPQRIIYRRAAPDTLVARIEGTTPRGERHQEWTMHRCEVR